MALLGNGFRENKTGTLFGATLLNGANPSYHDWRQHNTSRNRCSLTGYSSSVASVPSGDRPPVSWINAQKPGALSARGTIIGSGGASGPMQSGYNIAATLTGDGGITSAPLGLIVSLAATLIGSGTISSATANALATLVATLTGSGSVSATLQGLAQLNATLTGAGSVNANNTALATITATIRGYGDLTPEGIRDSVWNAVLAQYPTTGTAGKALAAASSGGVDYAALGEAVWASVSRTLTAGAAPDTAAIATAVLAALNATAIPVNMTQVKGQALVGTGIEADPWGPTP